MKLELLDISLAPLTSYEFFPGLEKIFDRDDIIMSMTEPLKSPPPTSFAGSFEQNQKCLSRLA